jgi:hypothetical protein
VTGYDDGLGIGNDDYVMEKDVEQYDEFGIVKVNLNYDDDSDFADEKPPADMSYYRDTNDMRGQNLTKGGPERPDTSGLGCWLLFSVSNIFLPIYSNFSIPAVILSIPVITAVILFTVTCF